jgi:hypothetical protein
MQTPNQNALAAAADYLARGWQPIPIAAGQKAPTLPRWQSLRLSADNLAAHFAGQGNIGLLLGEPSRWLVDVDLDCAEARGLASQHLPPTGLISGRPGNPRSHYWYLADGATTRKHSDPRTRAMICELRSTGCQTVVGPSIHPSGEPYDVLAGEPATVDAAELGRAVERLANAVILARYGEVPKAPRATPAQTRQDGIPRDPVDGGPEIERRAAAYLDAMPPGIQGQCGSNPTYAAAAALVNGFALDPETAYRLLAERYNPRCVPPWSEAELRHKLADALNKPHDRPRGYLRDAELPQAPAGNTTPPPKPARRIDAPHDTPGASGYAPIVVRLSDVERKPISWVWPQRIPQGKLTLVAGEPGQGKSTLTCDIVARITTARPWPDAPPGSTAIAPPGDVVLLSAEDDVADTIAPRLDAAGADSSRVVALQGVEFSGGGQRCFSLEGDLAALEQTIAGLPNCRLVVIDPVSAYCGRVDSHNNTAVRGLLMPLSDLASRYNVAVLMVTHLSKGEAQKALHRFMGSIAFAAAARACWLVGIDADDEGRRLFLPVKSNLAKNVGGLAFRIVDRNVGGETVGAIEWVPGRVNTTAESLLSGEGGPTAADDCAAWLESYLADGPKLAADGEDAARANDFSRATVRRAKKAIGVISHKDGFQGEWLWLLPGQSLWTGPKGAPSALGQIA